ncbi:carbonic anhydrase [Cantharellus anzutake]|uniref:carbonic anhydrase n=1 Tax=Cantharellus anzutake TaxID=1750568 RepID=UPI001907B6AC|nr:carbonic anhydrase [Cantharellus anzutake]KAF8327279.1 carbonic anhydrase [Cantharellus anzutake]
MTTPDSNALLDLLIANISWAGAINKVAPNFFPDSALGQSPKVLWIGCSDSRVPESVITVRKPGDVFVHRNIANQFVPNDSNILSVIQYAVLVLKVQHSKYGGHTKCGGAAASYDLLWSPDPPQGILGTPLGDWLEPLINLARELGPATNREEGVLRLLEENVRRAAMNIARSDVVQQARMPVKGESHLLHGWIYVLETGTLRDLCVFRDD